MNWQHSQLVRRHRNEFLFKGDWRRLNIDEYYCVSEKKRNDCACVRNSVSSPASIECGLCVCLVYVSKSRRVEWCWCGGVLLVEQKSRQVHIWTFGVVRVYALRAVLLNVESPAIVDRILFVLSRRHCFRCSDIDWGGNIHKLYKTLRVHHYISNEIINAKSDARLVFLFPQKKLKRTKQST